MKSTDVINPTAIKYPVAINGLKNTIPLAPTGTNAASIEEGFPELTMKPIAQGGLPPMGQDFNGLFYQATDYKAFLQDGGYITFSQTVSDLIGGYPSGAILDFYTPGTNSYTKVVSLIDDNTYNFNLDASYIDDIKWKYVEFGGANTALSNLSTYGENRLHALKGYLENGTLYSDSQLYNDVFKYANSTFDLSKFTVVGNPSITADGVASGLSGSNYITAIPSTLYYNKSNWHLKFQKYFDASGTSTIDYCDFVGSTYSHIKYEYGWNSIVLSLVDTTDTEIFIAVENVRDKFVTGNIIVDIYYSSTSGYYFTLSQNGTTYTSATSSNTNQIKNSSTDDLIYLNDATTTFDLKTLELFVDGIPVFTGTQTGEDVISSENSYTIFGTGATVDSNNIASGFSTSSGIKYDINYAGNSYNTFELYLGEYELTTIDTAQWFYKNTKIENSIQSGFMIQFNNQNKLRFFGGSGTANNDIFSGLIGSVTHAQNAKVKVKLVFDGSNYTLYSSDNGGAWVEENTKATTLKILFPTEVILGQDQSYFRGKINLNDIQTIIDGSIKFALTELSIPYILSSTGSKIVDSAYRDRVIAVYRQEGKALYYTIDYINKNVTLPMGEVYGFIEENKEGISTNAAAITTKQTIGDWCITTPTTVSTATLNRPCVVIENYVNGKDGYRIWSDGFIEQWGYKATTVNAQQEYTLSLLKTFSDTDYFFTRTPDWKVEPSGTVSSFYDNGYTSKSTTQVVFKMHESSMQNGTDWYACGY